MDDDDEFGDLYTDVLHPVSAAPPTSSASAAGWNPPLDLNLHSDDEDDILYGAPDRNPKLPPHQTLAPVPDKIEKQRISGGDSGGVANSIDENKAVDGGGVRVESKIDESGVIDAPNVELRARVSEGASSVQKSVFGDVNGEIGERGGVLMEKDGIFEREEVEEKLDVEVDVEEMDSGPVIPGLSGGGGGDSSSFIPGVFYDQSTGADAKASRKDDGVGGGDDWDSDSEDDLQIVLNEQSGPPGLQDDDDEDGEDLVIVADGDQVHQSAEEQEWGDDSAQAADGERKEPGEPGKANGAMVGAVGARIGYSSHGYHPHHSQFKVCVLVYLS